MLWFGYPNTGRKAFIRDSGNVWARLKDLAAQKERKILERHLVSDHVHISIPPKYSVSRVVGFIKGKSTIAIARNVMGRSNVTGPDFWARGYCVSTVGKDEGGVREFSGSILTHVLS